MNSFSLKTALINSQSRADWKMCFHSGADDLNWEKKFALYSLVEKMGLRLNVNKSSENYFKEAETWGELICRFFNLPRMMYLIYNSDMFSYIDKNFPCISEGNFNMCAKFYLLGMLYSVFNHESRDNTPRQ